jgi:citronellol/citronellal dehydrogenase
MGVHDGKVIIVTGSSRGIGKGLALGLAAEGAKVVCAARSYDSSLPGLPGTVAQTVDEITAAGGTALPLRCDVNIEADLDNLIAKTVEAYGRIDVLVNNAMAPTRGTFDESTVEMWDESMRANVRSLFLLCKLVVPIMASQGGGAIINISSGGAAHESTPFMPPGYVTYAVAKAALERFSTALAPEIVERGVTINAMRPGAVKTELTTLELPADTDWSTWKTPADVVPAVSWLSQQIGTDFTGKVIDSTQFGDVWP